jgi:hypothetical protein
VGNYNALQVVLRRRMSKGLQFQVAYTYSKTLTDDTGNGTFPGTGGVSGDASNPMQGYGPASFETPQRIVANFVWQIPGKLNGLPGQILSGWNVSGVVTLQSGSPLTFTDTAYPNIYGGSARAQLCPGATSSTTATPGPTTSRLTDYFNVNSVNCAPPVIGNGYAFGDSGMGVVLGPGEHAADLSVGRIFKMPRIEGSALQFRAEFYNAFNNPNFSASGTSASSSAFGQITSMSIAPRLVQFGLKYLF